MRFYFLLLLSLVFSVSFHFMALLKRYLLSLYPKECLQNFWRCPKTKYPYKKLVITSLSSRLFEVWGGGGGCMRVFSVPSPLPLGRPETQVTLLHVPVYRLIL